MARGPAAALLHLRHAVMRGPGGSGMAGGSGSHARRGRARRGNAPPRAGRGSAVDRSGDRAGGRRTSTPQGSRRAGCGPPIDEPPALQSRPTRPNGAEAGRGFRGSVPVPHRLRDPRPGARRGHADRRRRRSPAPPRRDAQAASPRRPVAGPRSVRRIPDLPRCHARALTRAGRTGTAGRPAAPAPRSARGRSRRPSPRTGRRAWPPPTRARTARAACRSQSGAAARPWPSR